MSRRRAAWLIEPLAWILGVGCAAPSPRPSDGASEVAPRLRSSAWELQVEPATLAIRARPIGDDGVAGEVIEVAAPSLARGSDGGRALVAPGRAADRLSFELPDRHLRVELRLIDARLDVRITSSVEQVIEWPESGLAGGDDAALVVPLGEGLRLPLSDAFWLGVFARGVCHDASAVAMPFWGMADARATATTILASDLRTSLCLRAVDGRLGARARHAFRERDGLAAYEVAFVLDGPGASPIAPALAYRDWLVARGEHVPFAAKAAAPGEADKLLGAVHVYLWGDGRSRETVDALRALGVDRALLLVDEGSMEDAQPMPAEAMQRARALGYLVGPYTTLQNVQDPTTADDRACVFDAELFARGGVQGADGKRLVGFGGRGFQLSSEALARSPVDYLAQRAEAALARGANAMFLDTDGFGELFDDFDPAHPMTVARDRANRLARMRYLGAERGLVLGSESAAAWSVPLLHYTHGIETPDTPVLWERLGDKQTIGGYWPPARPKLFFKTLEADDELARAAFDPRYRLPLYQAVFHDSIVSADRWEFSLGKYVNLTARRTALGLLYAVPSMWSLDRAALRAQGPRLSALQAVFGPLHRDVGARRLDDFTWLTPDHLVQSTRFGDVTITANFASDKWQDLGANCVEIRRAGRAATRFCPEP